VKLGPIVFQPSELGKLAAIVALAWWFTRYEQRSKQFLHGFVLPMMLIGVLMVLILREEDLGTTMLIGATMVAVMFVAGSNPLYMALLAAAGCLGILFIATHMNERMARLVAFLDLAHHKEGAGLQQWESLKAFGLGGVSGLGLGESVEKMQYLPYAHTDFIFPIIGEELGLFATLLIVLAFLLVTLSGVTIALQARDRFGLLLGFGLIINLALQACVNIGMTTALLPNKGMPLPFISSGGSNLCLCLLFTGVLLNIYRQGNLPEAGQVAHAAKLRSRPTPRI
jgi:cell division protein FtsW